MHFSPSARSSLGSAGVVAAVCALLAVTGVLAPAERFASDAVLRLVTLHAEPPKALEPDVAIVALDPQSLRAFQSWPWPRRLYAQAIERLEAAGARAIAFDIDLSTPRNAADDAELARAIARSGRVALATFRQVQPLPGGGELEVASVPIEALAGHAAALGSVLMPVESDGVVRFAPRYSTIGGRNVETLAAAALRIAARDGAATLPRDARLLLDYRRSRGIPEIPIVDVIEGHFDARDVAGRAVLIGATAAEFQDLWETPLAPARPGVWIQAVAYRTLAAERGAALVLHAAPAWLVLAATFAACLLVQACAGFGPRLRLSALAGFCAAAVAGSTLLAWRGLLLPPVAPVTGMCVMHVLGLERVRDRLRGLLAQRERSLTAIFQVGEVAAAPLGGDPLGAALALLAEVVDASAVALLRSSGEGLLDGRRLDWQRRGGARAGDLELAARALAQRAMVTAPRRGDGSAGLCAYAPLFAGPRAVGVLVVERESMAPLERLELRTLATVGAQIALLAENLRLVDDLRSTFDASIEAIASAVEARDGYTESHCRRLAIFSVSMAERLGLEPEEVEAIRLGALLHDVGKIGVRDEVLLKPARFTPEERAEMQRHSALGHHIVRPIHGLRPTTLACVRHHHERWDGTGYPDGLVGEQIPLGARIVCIVDVWDALSTDRPYKKAYDQATAREILEKQRGTFFDPALVDLFLEILDEEGEEMLALSAAARR
jgi:putative nucleotidyltransferase with HDIG domain